MTTSAFDAQAERMRRIFRGEERYGHGTPSEQATRFRFEAMLPEIIRRARENSRATARPAVDLLVSLSGFSPAATILAYELLEPARLFVISSLGTDRSIDVIHEHLVRPGKLPARNFRHQPCDGTDPLAIYRLVKDEVAAATAATDRPAAIIDITGGKKVMSAAAALVAWRLDLRLCYVDSAYDPELRQPVPGSERLLILENPTTLFGDQEMESALETFRSGAFAAARERFAALAESMSEPSRARLLRDLAGLYQAWSDLDLARMPGRVGAIRKSLADPRARVGSAAAAQLEKQLKFVEQLSERGEPVRFLPNFYVLGQHYHDLHRFDFAALLYYRTAEGCLIERLERRFPGFDCGGADYRLLQLPVADLLDRYNGIVRQLGRPSAAALPGRIGFLDAAVLLFATGDELLPRIQVRDVSGLSYLCRLAEARNKSVLAHGLRSVPAEECEQLRALALRCLRALWALQRADEDVDELCASLRFVVEL
jgi:Csm6 HEPN domain